MSTIELQSKIDALEAKLAKAEQELSLLRKAAELAPIGVVVTDSSLRTVLCNAAMRTIAATESTEQTSVPAYELFLADGVTPASKERNPTTRALAGEAVDGLESLLRPTAAPEQARWISASSRPIRTDDGTIEGAITIIRDVTEHKELLAALDNAIVASDGEKRELIAKLEEGIQALSTPIIEVWDDILALPVIGAMDDKRGAEITSRLLEEIVERGSRFVIIDWTGVEIMDTSSAQHLLDLVRAVSLVGAECILTGIRPAVAVSLLHLDVRFEHLRLLRNVKYGLKHCLTTIKKDKGSRL